MASNKDLKNYRVSSQNINNLKSFTIEYQQIKNY